MRPHLEQFLKELSQIADVFVLTSSDIRYATTIIDHFDQGRQWIRHVFAREYCQFYGKKCVKKLTHFKQIAEKYDKEVFLVDNSYGAMISDSESCIPILN